MNCSLLDSDLEEAFNDIEEFIQSEVGSEPLAVHTITDKEISDLSALILSREQRTNQAPSWIFSGNSRNALQHLNGASRVSSHETHEAAASRVLMAKVEVEVLVMNLKDVYDKRTKKTKDNLEYHLEDSVVTLILQASDEIHGVRAFVQRCAEAAIRTHDTTGPVEMELTTVDQGRLRRVVTVNLDSASKTPRGEIVYSLEKADVSRRNQWELIIQLEFASGLVGRVKSRPFRVTTKGSSKKSRCEDISIPGYVQKICRTISSRHNQRLSSTVLDGASCLESRNFSHSFDPKEDDEAGRSLSKELLQFSLADESEAMPRQKNNVEARMFGSNPTTGLLALPRLKLLPNTALDGQLLLSYYSRDASVNLVIEQPELPGLLKLVGASSTMQCGSARRANGYRSAGEDFWWSCGRCFFQRRKKSTIRTHVIEGVCQKPLEMKTSRRKRTALNRKRPLSCDMQFSQRSLHEALIRERQHSV